MPLVCRPGNAHRNVRRLVDDRLRGGDPQTNGVNTCPVAMSRAARSASPCRAWGCASWAASAANVGIPLRRRFSASGSPPARARLRLARAAARASLSGTSGKPQSPSSRRRPRMTSRCTQLRVPDGCTTTEAPDVMWGTDATATHTAQDGLVTVFRHRGSLRLGGHRPPRRQARRPLRGTRTHPAGRPPLLRGPHPQRRPRPQRPARSRLPVHEPPLPARTRLPRYQGQPRLRPRTRGNGVAERFIRTLKEQLLRVRDFDSLEDLNTALQEWSVPPGEWRIIPEDHTGRERL